MSCGASVMLEKGRKKFACVLAFDVPVSREAQELADQMGVRVFTADIIYHLFDQFTAYLKQVGWHAGAQLAAPAARRQGSLAVLGSTAPWQGLASLAGCHQCCASSQLSCRACACGTASQRHLPSHVIGGA